jgi:hypothetical protein
VILLSALLLGLLAGWGWAGWHKRPYRAPDLKYIWLALAAFLPQLVMIYLPRARGMVPDWLAVLALAVSLVGFLIFAWLNRGLPGMPVLLGGLILNLLVIAANGGWMPISPETASHLAGGSNISFSSPGSRFGQKDILLLPQNTRLVFLSDRFLLPAFFPYQVAFSLGDVLVAIGAFWLLAGSAGDGRIATE